MKKIHELFFYLTVLFIPVQFGLHFWPEWTFVLGRRLDYLSPTIYLIDIMVILTLVTWILSIKLTRNQVSGIRNYASKIILFFLYLIFIFLNTILSVNPLVTLLSWVRILEFIIFGYYIIRTKPNTDNIIKVATFSVVSVSLLALAQYLLGRSVGGILWFTGERTFTIDTPGIARYALCIGNSCSQVLRSYATFPHPNVLAGYLLVFLPFILNNLFIPKKTGNNRKTFNLTYLLNFLILILGILALGLTFSRTAILLFIISVTFIFVFINRKLMSLIFILFSFFALYFFITDLSHLGQESVVVRNDLNIAAIKIWTHYPITGVGLGTFLMKLPEFIKTRTLYFLQPAHNIYLLVLSETGLFGAALFIGLLLMPLSKWIKSKNRSRLPLFLILYTALLIFGLFDHFPISLEQGLVLTSLFWSMAYLES